MKGNRKVSWGFVHADKFCMKTLKRGLKPFDPVKHARFGTFEGYGFSLPTPSYPIDQSQGITDWLMLGNGPDPTLTVNGGNPVGDCGVAAVPFHAGMLTAALGKLTEAPPTANEAVDLYFEYTNGQDTGVDLGDWLLWLFKHKLIEGFVALSDATAATLDGALQAFSVVLVGVNLTDDADDLFSNGQPWTLANGETPDTNDGHAILKLKAQGNGGNDAWCTWGAVQESTPDWSAACVQQGFVVLTKEEAEAAGFPFATLVADLEALGGKAVTPPAPPAPSPTPTPPVPTPVPVPDPPAPEPTPVPDPTPPAPTPDPTPPAPPDVPNFIKELWAWIQSLINSVG